MNEAHVGQPRCERLADALQPRQVDLAQVPQRERRVAGRHPGLRLFDADEVRVQRLAAVVELDLEMGELHLEVLADAIRLVRPARRSPRAP